MFEIQSLVGSGIGWSLLPESEIQDSLVGLNIDNFELKHSMRLFRNLHIEMSRAKETFVDLVTPALIDSTEPKSKQGSDDSRAILASVASEFS